MARFICWVLLVVGTLSVSLLLAVAGDDLPSIQSTPKGQGEGHLEHMAIHSSGGNIFIGGWNVIHVLSSEDLTPVKKITTGPLKDNMYCPPDPDKECPCPLLEKDSPECLKYQRTDQISVNKALLLQEEHSTLLACSNLYYGFCERISLDGLEITESVFNQPIVGADTDHKTVMFTAPGASPDKVLYVGVSSVVQELLVSAAIQHIPMIASRDAATLNFVKPRSYVDRSSSQKFTFVDGFSYNGFNYFILVSQLVTGSVSKIVRVCQKDTSYRSYVEMKIMCELRGVGYNIASDVTLGQLGAHLAGNLDRVAGEDAMFVSYRSTESSSSALCVYSLADIEDVFYQTIQTCFQGDGMLGPDHVPATAEPCTKTVSCQFWYQSS